MTQKTIAVICNGYKGEFDPGKRLFYYPRRPGQSGQSEEEDGSRSRLFTPTEFERHAGMAASKKWKYSVRVDLEAEPEIDWDAAAMGPFTLGKWMEVNGYDTSRSARSNASKTYRGSGGGSSFHNNRNHASSLSMGGHGYSNENYHKSSDHSDAAGKSPRRKWLNFQEAAEGRHQGKGGPTDALVSAAAAMEGMRTGTRRLVEFEKFRLHDTSPRIGSAFQADIPNCLTCKPLEDPDTLAHPEREGSVLFETEEQAKQSAIGPEKAGADALPLSAIYDTDGSSDEESETIQREKSRRTRRRPKWLQGSVNMFNTEAEKEAIALAEKMRGGGGGGHNNNNNNNNHQSSSQRISPASTKQSVGGRNNKGDGMTNNYEDDETPRSKTRNPYFGSSKGQEKKQQRKRSTNHHHHNNNNSFKIARIEQFGDKEVLVLVVGKDGRKWTGTLRPVLEQKAKKTKDTLSGGRARKKAKTSDDIRAENARATKARRLLEQVTRIAERDMALNHLAFMPDSTSEEDSEDEEEMVMKVEASPTAAAAAGGGDRSKAIGKLSPNAKLQQRAKNGVGEAKTTTMVAAASPGGKCATETVMVAGKVKRIHRGHGGRFASPNGPREAENKNNNNNGNKPSRANGNNGRPSQAQANNISVQQQQAMHMAAQSPQDLAVAAIKSQQQQGGGGLYYPPLTQAQAAAHQMSQLNPAALSFMGMPGGWPGAPPAAPQFGFPNTQGMQFSPEQFVKWNTAMLAANSAAVLQAQQGALPNAQMNFPVNMMGLMAMPHTRAPPNTIFQKNQR